METWGMPWVASPKQWSDPASPLSSPLSSIMFSFLTFSFSAPPCFSCSSYLFHCSYKLFPKTSFVPTAQPSAFVPSQVACVYCELKGMTVPCGSSWSLSNMRILSALLCVVLVWSLLFILSTWWFFYFFFQGKNSLFFPETDLNRLPIISNYNFPAPAILFCWLHEDCFFL